jgi:hypothetical protein
MNNETKSIHSSIILFPSFAWQLRMYQCEKASCVDKFWLNERFSYLTANVLQSILGRWNFYWNSNTWYLVWHYGISWTFLTGFFNHRIPFTTWATAGVPAVNTLCLGKWSSFIEKFSTNFVLPICFAQENSCENFFAKHFTMQMNDSFATQWVHPAVESENKPEVSILFAVRTRDSPYLSYALLIFGICNLVT